MTIQGITSGSELARQLERRFESSRFDTIATLAKEVGVNRSHLNKVIKGHEIPSRKLLCEFVSKTLKSNEDASVIDKFLELRARAIESRYSKSGGKSQVNSLSSQTLETDRPRSSEMNEPEVQIFNADENAYDARTQLELLRRKIISDAIRSV